MTFSWRDLHSHSGKALVKAIVSSAVPEIINIGIWLKQKQIVSPKQQVQILWEKMGDIENIAIWHKRHSVELKEGVHEYSYVE